MNEQGKYVTVRGAVLGIAIMGLAGALAGCTTSGGAIGTTATTNAVFGITFDTNAPKDEAISVSPGEGDAWIHSAEDGSSTITP